MSTRTQTEKNAFFIWFDLEFTSLNLEEARILQVALMVTDDRLRRVAPPEEDINLCIRLEDEAACSDWVRAELPELLERCRSDEAVTIEAADRVIADRLDRLIGPPAEKVSDRPVLSGNSLHNDWALARKYLPGLMRRVHYRLLDVSSWKIVWNLRSGQPAADKDDAEWVRKHFPSEFAADGAKHDAYYDIHASVSELNYYLTQGVKMTNDEMPKPE